jgi:uncharacterized protein YhfF
MSDQADVELPVIEFAFPGELRDRLIAAILRGEKTATTGLLVEWELDGDPIPRTGERFAVIDSAGERVAVIEITDVQVVDLGEVDLAVAREEGEGFDSVAAWRAGHEAFWNDYIEELRARLGDRSWALGDQTQVIVERFRLLGTPDAPSAEG